MKEVTQYWIRGFITGNFLPLNLIYYYLVYPKGFIAFIILMIGMSFWIYKSS